MKCVTKSMPANVTCRSMASKPELILISGFLGAGKTTLIQRLLKDVLPKEHTVILENEYGKVDMDGELLRAQGADVVSVYAGCICCTSTQGLMDSLENIAVNYAARRIILEPTGVAKLGEILRLLQSDRGRELVTVQCVMTVVDASNFQRRMMVSKEFFENQIKFSRMILLSKVNQLTPQAIDTVTWHILQINPECTVVAEDWDELEERSFHDLIEHAKPVKPGTGQTITMKSDMKTVFLESEMPLKTEFPVQFFAALEQGDFGEVLRVKGSMLLENGAVKNYDYVPGEYLLSDTVTQRKTQLCVVGVNLDQDKMELMIQNTM